MLFTALCMHSLLHFLIRIFMYIFYIQETLILCFSLFPLFKFSLNHDALEISSNCENRRLKISFYYRTAFYFRYNDCEVAVLQKYPI